MASWVPGVRLQSSQLKPGATGLTQAFRTRLSPVYKVSGKTPTTCRHMLGKMRKALKVGNLLVPGGEDVFPAQIPHISSLSTLLWAQPFLGGSASRVEAFPPGPTHP